MILHIFFFNDTATTEIYTLSLHDALPIFLSLNVISTISIFAPCWRFYRLQYKDNNVPFHLYYIQQEQYFHNQYHRLFLLFFLFVPSKPLPKHFWCMFQYYLQEIHIFYTFLL